MAKEIDMNKYSRLFVSEAKESLRIANDAISAGSWGRYAPCFAPLKKITIRYSCHNPAEAKIA